MAPNDPVDPVRELLRNLIPKGRWQAVSRAIGQNQTYIQQFITYGTPRRLPEQVREALGRMFARNPNDFRPPGERQPQPESQPAPPPVLDAGLQERARAVAERLVGTEDTPECRQLCVDVASTVYVLLEAEARGVRISDNEVTLRAIDLLITRIKAARGISSLAEIIKSETD